MPSLVVFHFFLLTLLAQAPTQSAKPSSELPRIQLTQDQLCCLFTNFVKPIYPRQARLEHKQGVVKLVLVIGVDGSIVGLKAVSGDPLLLDSTMKAVRQWRFLIGGFAGRPREIEVPLSFTFKIEHPPKPAYLHLTNGKVIRADEVREFTDRVDYTVGRHAHHIASSSVTDIDSCARFVFRTPLKEGECIPSGGGPSFDIRGIPLLPSIKTSHSMPASR